MHHQTKKDERREARPPAVFGGEVAPLLQRLLSLRCEIKNQFNISRRRCVNACASRSKPLLCARRRPPPTVRAPAYASRLHGAQNAPNLCRARPGIAMRMIFRFAAMNIDVAATHFQFFVKFSRNMESRSTAGFRLQMLSAY
jgi:hypothetical protein